MTPLIDPAIERYIHDHTRARPALFDELREVTYASMQDPQMQVGRVEGALLKLLIAASGAKHAVEIGTFTGYSALSIAEGLPDDGTLITCDIDPEAARVAQSFFDKSPHGKKISLRLGDALETLRALPKSTSVDFAFIDADKERYVDYYEEILPRLRKNGIIAADNALWSGSVVDPQTESAKAIARFNDHVLADPRVENVLLSVRDGLMLARKL